MSAAADNVHELWRVRLALRKSGEPYADERNILTVLRSSPAFTATLQYDEFHDHILVMRRPPWIRGRADDANGLDWQQRTWTDEDCTNFCAWLQGEGFTGARKSIAQDCVIAAAKDWVFHPVRLYLKSLQNEGKWDGVERLPHLLSHYFHAKDDPEYLSLVGTKFLIGAVARVMEPGCQMDNTLVLEGGQGIGKSTAVRVLARGWTSDVTGDLHSKDAAIGLQGNWIPEIAELAAFTRSETETIKGFISRRVDRYRPPYGRNAIDRARQCVFIATTNDNSYLKDSTGGRRFWPVDCGHVDIPALQRDCDMLWAEAMHRYGANEPWHLDMDQSKRAAIEQAARRQVTTVDADVLEYADRMVSQGHKELEMRSILRDVFHLDTAQDPQRAGHIGLLVSRALTSDGWVRLKPVGRGKNRRQMYRHQGESS